MPLFLEANSYLHQNQILKMTYNGELGIFIGNVSLDKDTKYLCNFPNVTSILLAHWTKSLFITGKDFIAAHYKLERTPKIPSKDK